MLLLGALVVPFLFVVLLEEELSWPPVFWLILLDVLIIYLKHLVTSYHVLYMFLLHVL